MLLVDFDGVRVALVPWPSEADALDGEPADRPRLLLVATDSEPPEVRAGVEDWIRVPADDHTWRSGPGGWPGSRPRGVPPTTASGERRAPP